MPRITIRAKLLLLSVVMLSIPYVGFQYLRATERYLQGSLEDALLAVAGALAISLQDQAHLFRSASDLRADAYPLFVHSLTYPIHVDGYTDDWENYVAWADTFAAEGGAGTERSFDLIVGEYANFLNILVDVHDDSLVYQAAGAYAPASADTIELRLGRARDGAPRRVFLGAAAPGALTAYSITEHWDYSRSRNPVANVLANWRETETGYVVELQLPLALANGGVGIVVHDRDAGSNDSARVASFDLGAGGAPNVLLRTSVQLQQIIARIGLKKGRRLWVINRSGQVLASGGSLASESKRGAINILYTWILPRANDSFEDDLRAASRLRSDEVLRALAGDASSRWRSSPDERAVIVSAAHPVRASGELVGAVVVEETTNSIQTLQRDAMATLFNQSIAVFVGVSLVLLLFASRLSFRIGKLRDQAEQAIDPYGRVVGEISGSAASDELGDLSRSYAGMLERLAEYNAYLESMAGKLSHELRTPLAVVSSSLQNLESARDDAERQRYAARASEGVLRLQNLVSRLGEASRLEQAIASAERAPFDPVAVLRGCVGGYRNAYPERQFELVCDITSCRVDGSDDLFVQLLDKLVDNAVSFGTVGTPVMIRLEPRRDAVALSVTNYGSRLPDAMQRQIFNSMVSLRARRDDAGPHLGLGLFIARLIVEFHRGEITAHNLADGSGVTFRVTLPLCE